MNDTNEQRRIIKLAKHAKDIVVGGPPCQGYSGLNNHRTKEKYDDLNKLPWVFAHIAAAVKPKVIIMEEVKTVDKQLILGLEKFFNKRGYDHVEWRVLNSKHFSVPQSRNRMFLIATKKTLTGGASCLPGYQNESIVTVRDALLLSSLPRCKTGPPVTTTNEKWIRLRESFDQSAGVDQLTIAKPNWHVAAYGIVDLDKPSPTITTNALSAGSGKYTFKRGNSYYVMSEEEAARLQSFGPHFKFLGPKRSVYRQIGNSVPPLLAYHIGQHIKYVTAQA